MTYKVVEVFTTLQGEGRNAGTPSIFVRFAGCNLWTGHQEHRERDAERHGVECPKWCDTDFRGGTKYGSDALVSVILNTANKEQGWFHNEIPLIVFTGGEPLLQLDQELLTVLRPVAPNAKIAVETNGTVRPRNGVLELVDHICVSPKTAAEKIQIRSGTEIKIVFPAYDPLTYEGLAKGFTHWYVSPEAETSDIGDSRINEVHEQAAVRFVLRHPKWKLSLQSHKILGVP